MTPEHSMRIYLAECALHVELLQEALQDTKAWMPLSPSNSLEKGVLRILDQIAYRYGKLQDTMGEKVLPLILELAQETIPASATFAEKLNRLERIGAIPSADEWKKFRIIRNALAHDYPDEPELRIGAITRFLEGAVTLIELYRFVKNYLETSIATTERKNGPH